MLNAKCQIRRLLLALLFCLALVLPASARDWHIARFETHIYVAPDGVTTVNEHISVVFVGEYHGIYRDIPIEYPGPARRQLHAVPQGHQRPRWQQRPQV